MALPIPPTPTAESLARLLWCAMVLLKLAGTVQLWRRRGGKGLSRSFSQELRRRGLGLSTTAGGKYR